MIAMTAFFALQGHDDWVFGIAWITERHLVTGDRPTGLLRMPPAALRIVTVAHCIFVALQTFAQKRCISFS